MSLQRPPHSLPPEKSPDETNSAADTASTSPLKSQFRYWKLAWRELEQIKGYRWVKVGSKLVNTILTLTGLAALSIVLWLWPLLPPLAWLSIVFVLIVLASQASIYLFGHLHDRTVGNFENEKREVLRAAGEDVMRYRSLYTEAQRKAEGFEDYGKKLEALVKAVESERDLLKSELEERDRYKLFLIVDFKPFPSPYRAEFHQSEVSLHLHEDVVAFEPGQPIELSWSTLTADLIIFFENRHADKVVIRTVGVSLLRKTPRGNEKSIPFKTERLNTYPITSSPSTLDGYTVKGLSITTPMRLQYHMELGARLGQRLNHDCFLRVTMDAMNQPPFNVDIDVDWEKARNSDGPVPVSPRSELAQFPS